MRKLNFSKVKQFEELHISVYSLVLFIKPLGSIFHRVFSITKDQPEKVEELKQALSDLCIRKVDNVWYFDLRKEQNEDDIYTILQSMGFTCMSIVLDKDPEHSN